MVVLGLIIVVIALALGALLLLGTGGPDLSGNKVDITFLDTITVQMNPLALVIAGMATMFLLWLGLVIIRSALARKARLRRERKEQERATKERLAAAESARLQEREAADRQHEAELRDQKLSTTIARERAEVAEAEAADTTRTAPASVRDRAAADRDHAGDTERISLRDSRGRDERR